MPKTKWKNSASTSTYYAWRNMCRRCSSPQDPSWSHYGGRGIKVCAGWASYDQFVTDMGLKPEGMTLERLDTNGNYEPQNCAWVTLRENLNNRRNTVRVRGIPVTVLADATGIKADTLRKRVSYGIEDLRILLPRAKPRAELKHGTRIGYERYGCRCEACKAFNTERARAFRMRRRLVKTGEGVQ